MYLKIPLWRSIERVRINKRPGSQTKISDLKEEKFVLFCFFVFFSRIQSINIFSHSHNSPVRLTSMLNISGNDIKTKCWCDFEDDKFENDGQITVYFRISTRLGLSKEIQLLLFLLLLLLIDKSDNSVWIICAAPVGASKLLIVFRRQHVCSINICVEDMCLLFKTYLQPFVFTRSHKIKIAVKVCFFKWKTKESIKNNKWSFFFLGQSTQNWRVQRVTFNKFGRITSNFFSPIRDLLINLLKALY